METMKLDKLVPMTQFIFHLRNMTTSELCKTYPERFKLPVWTGSQSEMVKDMLAIDAIQWKLTGDYAKFLTQPLELWQIIPCSEAGEVLEEPPTYAETFAKNGNANAREHIKAYAEAKKRCLFEGFEWKSEMRNSGGNYTWFATNGKIEIVSQWGRLFLSGKIEISTIEVIATESCGITLTQTAKEMIIGTSR